MSSTTNPQNVVLFPGTRLIPAREVRSARFYNGRVALVVIEPEGGRVRLNVNLPDPIMDTLGPDDVAVRDYSECKGVLAALVSAGIVAVPHRHVESEHVSFPICKLLVTPRAL